MLSNQALNKIKNFRLFIAHRTFLMSPLRIARSDTNKSSHDDSKITKHFIWKVKLLRSWKVWKGLKSFKKHKMPVQELPEEFLRPIESPSNSSLSSNSSDVILINANYVRNGRSASVSSSTASTQDDSFEANVVNASLSLNRARQLNGVEDDELMYQPIKLPTEPTLEELLVSALVPNGLMSCPLNFLI